jgi:hypothetical protein
MMCFGYYGYEWKIAVLVGVEEEKGMEGRKCGTEVPAISVDGQRLRKERLLMTTV